ncbi:heavy metal-associated isoprenylated plant protein 36-like isoform X2 [Macadamia integrifolia]|uniref:heavy metal-associated isoprenylated plant protein 36-like isoform X2 n=1 Tax=Macadamia integrifolia TaxID=60698 RepID=UPI001C4F291E|nr:heavy metal-associated isoprenylated plant protein 36-like isoform X2 [Macadamia integrifolia]
MAKGGRLEETGVALGLFLQRVELKVSVNCCEGCKRKVKKVLQSIEGVLKTEIDSTEPKVTVVLGNIDPQILIKKLMKNGKQVEIWPCSSEKENTNNPAQVGDQGKAYGESAGLFTSTGKEKGKANGIGDGCGGGKKSVSGREQDHQGGGSTDNKQRKESSSSGSSANTNTKWEDCNQKPVETNSNYSAPPGPPPPPTQVVMSYTPAATIYPSMVYDTSNITSSATSTATNSSNIATTGHCYMVEPCAIPLQAVAPYYMMPMTGSYSDSSNYALPHQYNYVPTDHFLHQSLSPCYPPAAPVPMFLVGDYFSDDNTVGCHVM